MAWDKTNTGTLNQNDPGDNPKRPKWKGTLNVDGKDYDLAAWEKPSRDGGVFLSLKVSEPREGGRRQPREADSDSPF